MITIRPPATTIASRTGPNVRAVRPTASASSAWPMAVGMKNADAGPPGARRSWALLIVVMFDEHDATRPGRRPQGAGAAGTERWR